jgi:O-antigen/teichoic acid export membrane protein
MSTTSEISATTSLDDAPVVGSFAAGIVLTFGARLLMLAGVLGSSIIVARWLGPAGVGTLAVLNVTVALALQIASAGLPSANTYFIARDRKYFDAAWANSIVFAIAAGTSITIAVLVLAILDPTLFGGVAFRLLAVATASIPFQLLMLLGLNVLLAVNRIDLLNLLDAATPILLLLNAAVVLIFLGSGLTVLVWSNTAAAVLVALVIAVTIAAVSRGQEQPRRLRPNWPLLKRALRYGTKFYVSIMAGTIIIRADLLIVNHFRGAAEAGVYSVASQVGNLLLMLPAVIATLLFPRVASDPQPRGEFALRVTRHTSFVMFVFCAAAAAFSFVLPVVYGARFSGAVSQFLILLPGVYFLAIESVLVQHFTGTGLPAIIPVFWVITVAVNLGLNLAFVPRGGATAAAVNSSLSYALIFLLVATYFCLKTARQPGEIFVLRREELRQMLSRIVHPRTRTASSELNLT